MTSRLASAAFVVLLAGLIAGAAGLWVARGADPVQGQESLTFSQAFARVQADIGHPVCAESRASSVAGVPVDHDLGPSDSVPARARELVTEIGLSIDDFARDSRSHRLLFTRGEALRTSTDRLLAGAVVGVGLFDTGSQDGPQWVLNEFALFYECDVTDGPSDVPDEPSTEEEPRP